MDSDAIPPAPFTASNGEVGWTRDQVPRAVAALVDGGYAILGGELWLVDSPQGAWTGLVAQASGPDGVYAWHTERHLLEPLHEFVRRSGQETLDAVQRYPRPGEVPNAIQGSLVYNLTWCTEQEWADLGSRAV